MIDECPECGETKLSFADRRWGHCHRRAQQPIIRGDKSTLGYREDLARFPGDPEAKVSTKRGLNNLISTRTRRDGWEIKGRVGEIEMTGQGTEVEGVEDVSLGRQAVREALEEHHSA